VQFLTGDTKAVLSDIFVVLIVLIVECCGTASNKHPHSKVHVVVSNGLCVFDTVILILNKYHAEKPDPCVDFYWFFALIYDSAFTT